MIKILGKIAIFLLVILCTTITIFYAKGYRVNLTDNTFIHTGIFHIQTEPNRANFYLNEDFQGRSNRVLSSIPEGKYNVDIWLEDYHSTSYEVEIIAERSTPLSVFLFRKEPIKKTIEAIQEKIVGTHIGKSRNTALILIEKEVTENEIEYELLQYQTNTRFWQLGPNPSTVFSFSTNTEDKINEFSVSPNTKNIILEIAGENEEAEKKEAEDKNIIEKGRYIISLDTQSILANIDDIKEEIRWAHDSESIFWKDNEGIKKINLKESGAPKLAYSPTEDMKIIFYDSHTNGEIYILYEKEETPHNYASLSKITEQKEIPLIERIHFQEEDRFLQDWKEKEFIDFQLFTNSPQSTLFVGKPTEFLISKETSNILFNTEFASYIYDTAEDKFLLINPYKTEFLSFSPDGYKIAFLNLEREELSTFIFNKDPGNESVKLGGHYVARHINKEICDDFAWHQNSQNIYYTCENSLYTVDIKNKESLNIVRDFGKNILLETNKKVLTLLEKEEGLEIVEFTIN